MAKTHQVIVLLLGDADRLASQRFTDKQVFAAPLDLARWTHNPRLVVGVAPGRLGARRQAASRRMPMFCRCRLAKRFVRTLVIIMAAEPVEANLLIARCGRRRLRRFCLERAMHAFVPAIVLRA